jgi:hypothetical protein
VKGHDVKTDKDVKAINPPVPAPFRRLFVNLANSTVSQMQSASLIDLRFAAGSMLPARTWMPQTGKMNEASRSGLED